MTQQNGLTKMDGIQSGTFSTETKKAYKVMEKSRSKALKGRSFEAMIITGDNKAKFRLAYQVATLIKNWFAPLVRISRRSNNSGLLDKRITTSSLDSQDIKIYGISLWTLIPYTNIALILSFEKPNYKQNDLAKVTMAGLFNFMNQAIQMRRDR